MALPFRRLLRGVTRIPLALRMPRARASSRRAAPLLPSLTLRRYGESPGMPAVSPPGGQITSPSESTSGQTLLGRAGRPLTGPPRGRRGGVAGALPGAGGSARALGRGPGRLRSRGLRTRSLHSPSPTSGPGAHCAPPRAALGNPSAPHRGPRSHSLGEAVRHRRQRHLPVSSCHATSWPSVPAGPPASRWQRLSHWPCSRALRLGHRSSLQGPRSRLCSPWRVCRTHPHLEHET